MDKFGRNYILQIQGKDKIIHNIQFPLTCEFEIKRNLMSSSNTSTFRIYNLSLETRNAINKDFMDILEFRSIVFSAGYGDNPLTVCFKGNVWTCLSYRDEGRVDYITEIQAYDYGFAMDQAFSSFTLPVNSTKQQLLTQLSNDVINVTKNYNPQLSIGYIDSFNGVLPRGYRFAGFSWPRMIIESDNQCFIDNGKINILKTTSTLTGVINTLDDSIGLLAPPKRYQNCVKFETLFFPDIIPGQALTVNSSSSTLYNDTYKVSGFEHNGIISGAVNGKCKTEIMSIRPWWNKTK